MGYEEDKAVQYIAKQRIEKLYSFTKERRYDIYDRDGKYPGVTKAWLPYMIQPSLCGRTDCIARYARYDIVCRNLSIFDGSRPRES